MTLNPASKPAEIADPTATTPAVINSAETDDSDKYIIIIVKKVLLIMALQVSCSFKKISE